MKTNKYLLVVAVALCIGSLQAQTTVPHAFEAGQVASAAQVNANFAELEDAIDTQGAELSSLETELGTLSNTVAALNAQVSTLSGELAAAQSAVTALEAELATANSNIAARITTAAHQAALETTNASIAALDTLNESLAGRVTAVETAVEELGGANGGETQPLALDDLVGRTYCVINQGSNLRRDTNFGSVESWMALLRVTIASTAQFTVDPIIDKSTQLTFFYNAMNQQLATVIENADQNEGFEAISILGFNNGVLLFDNGDGETHELMFNLSGDSFLASFIGQDGAIEGDYSSIIGIRC